MIEFNEYLLQSLEEQRQSASARSKQESFLDMLGVLPGQRVLDLGCGSGALSRSVVPRVSSGGYVIGVDNSPAAVAFATHLSRGTEIWPLAFACADGHSLPFRHASFDAALCVSVLGFCEDAAHVLAEVQRVLRPGGRLLVANSDEDTRVYSGNDRDLGRRVTRAIADRARDPWVARRLPYLLGITGFRLTQEVASIDVERSFTPGTSGYTHAHVWRDYLFTNGRLSKDEYTRWIADLTNCQAEGSYVYSVATFAYLAER